VLACREIIARRLAGRFHSKVARRTAEGGRGGNRRAGSPERGRGPSVSADRGSARTGRGPSVASLRAFLDDPKRAKRKLRRSQQALRHAYRADLDERRTAEAELSRMLSLHEATIDSTADGILVVDRDGRMTSFNEQFVSMWRLPRDILEDRDDDRALAFVLDQLADPGGFLAKVRELYGNPRAESFDVIEFKDGREFERYSKPQMVDDEPVGRVWSFRDVTSRRRVERELREAEARYRSLVERLPGITYIAEAPGPDPRWLYVSPQVEPMLGYAAGEWKSDPSLWVSSIHPEDRSRVLQAHANSLTKGSFSIDYRMFTRDRRLVWFHDVGAVIRDEHGEPLFSHGFMLDITERKHSEQRVAFLAYHDDLTGLPNRAMFQEHLELAVARARRKRRSVAVLYMDLDRFKLVNDSFGHAHGDELLRQIAGRLQEITRAEDLVARHSGDEFLLLLGDIDPATAGVDGGEAVSRSAHAVTAKIHEALRTPFTIEGEQFYVDASIGISIHPADARDADQLIRHADAAMYESKRLGRGGTQIFARSTGGDSAEELTLGSRLRRAIEGEEFVLAYQPIIRLDSGELGGIEALIRWRDSERGVLMPLDFIPHAEETGLIERIGNWVIGEVCRQAAAWEKWGLTAKVGFNVSFRQLRQPEFAQLLIDMADAAGANPARLVAEITESVVMRDPRKANLILSELHACGVTTAIDDFGTGHSSLSRLMEVPADVLKIDRSFVSRLPDDPAAAAMVAGIVQIANGLGLQSVAEGVESDAQLEYLTGIGCMFGQGYRFSKALPAQEIEASWIETAGAMAR
jgi:diguanylate cyclase (GGDEF)-like protein/PAS domain S-box-containing protein